MAPALNVSPAAMTTPAFLSLSLSASLAMVVVFPVPLTPVKTITTGLS